MEFLVKENEFSYQFEKSHRIKRRRKNSMETKKPSKCMKVNGDGHFI